MALADVLKANPDMSGSGRSVDVASGRSSADRQTDEIDQKAMRVIGCIILAVNNVEDADMPERGRDVWASGDAYEPYVGRWSRLVAREFLTWLSFPPDRNWLDIGCGTGALSQTILDNATPCHVSGIDPSDGFVSFARHAVTDQRATFHVGDAQELPVANSCSDATVSGLVLNFVPDQPKAVREMKRATRAGGVVAAYVWDYAGEMQMMRRFWDAAVALDANAFPLDEGRRFPLCHPEPLANLFRDAGLTAAARSAGGECRPLSEPA